MAERPDRLSPCVVHRRRRAGHCRAPTSNPMRPCAASQRRRPDLQLPRHVTLGVAGVCPHLVRRHDLRLPPLIVHVTARVATTAEACPAGAGLHDGATLPFLFACEVRRRRRRLRPFSAPGIDAARPRLGRARRCTALSRLGASHESPAAIASLRNIAEPRRGARSTIHIHTIQVILTMTH